MKVLFILKASSNILSADNQSLFSIKDFALSFIHNNLVSRLLLSLKSGGLYKNFSHIAK